MFQTDSVLCNTTPYTWKERGLAYVIWISLAKMRMWQFLTHRDFAHLLSPLSMINVVSTLLFEEVSKELETIHAHRWVLLYWGTECFSASNKIIPRVKIPPTKSLSKAKIFFEVFLNLSGPWRPPTSDLITITKNTIFVKISHEHIVYRVDSFAIKTSEIEIKL